jgi:osmotically-inducible protein OsmY
MKSIHFFAAVVFAILLALPMSHAFGQSQERRTAPQQTSEYMSDAAITAKVKAALLAEPDLKSVEIHVETIKGTVQLSGVLSSQAAIQKALDVTRNVSGVKSVKNDLRLKQF